MPERITGLDLIEQDPTIDGLIDRVKAEREALKKGEFSPSLLEQFSSVADKVIAYRKGHKGMLPKEAWLKNLELAGSYFCVELLLVTPDGEPVLKLRQDPTATGGEIEWENKLHIPGTSVPASRRSQDILPGLIKKEIVKEGEGKYADRLANEAVYWGWVRYDEPERKTTADTLVMALVINPEDERLQEDLKVLKKGVRLNGVVIDQQKPVIREYRRKSRGKSRPTGSKGVWLDTRPEAR